MRHAKSIRTSRAIRLLKMHPIALGYLTAVLLAAGWTMYVDAALPDVQRERLLPGIVLAVLTFPLSQSLELLCVIWPRLISLQVVQVGYMVLCGLLQAGLLAWRRPGGTQLIVAVMKSRRASGKALDKD